MNEMAIKNVNMSLVRKALENQKELYSMPNVNTLVLGIGRQYTEEEKKWLRELAKFFEIDIPDNCRAGIYKKAKDSVSKSKLMDFVEGCEEKHLEYDDVYKDNSKCVFLSASDANKALKIAKQVGLSGAWQEGRTIYIQDSKTCDNETHYWFDDDSWGYAAALNKVKELKKQGKDATLKRLPKKGKSGIGHYQVVVKDSEEHLRGAQTNMKLFGEIMGKLYEKKEKEVNVGPNDYAGNVKDFIDSLERANLHVQEVGQGNLVVTKSETVLDAVIFNNGDTFERGSSKIKVTGKTKYGDIEYTINGSKQTATPKGLSHFIESKGYKRTKDMNTIDAKKKGYQLPKHRWEVELVDKTPKGADVPKKLKMYANSEEDLNEQLKKNYPKAEVKKMKQIDADGVKEYSFSVKRGAELKKIKVSAKNYEEALAVVKAEAKKLKFEGKKVASKFDGNKLDTRDF